MGPIDPYLVDKIVCHLTTGFFRTCMEKNSSFCNFITELTNNGNIDIDSKYIPELVFELYHLGSGIKPSSDIDQFIHTHLLNAVDVFEKN